MALIRHIPFGDSFANTTVTGPIGGNGALLGGDNTSAHRVAGPGPSVPHAFDFNGVDDYVYFSSGFTVGTQVTLSAWIYLDSYSNNAGGNDYGYRMIVEGVDAGNANINDGGIYLGVSGTSNGVLQGAVNWDGTVSAANRCQLNGSVVPLGQWHHVMFTVNGNTCKLFQNGVQTGTNTFTNIGIYDPATWLIGKFGTPALNGYFDGKIAQVKIFDTDESANVATLYAEPNAASDITSNLKCRLALDEGTGTTVADFGSEGVNATLNGAAWAAGKIGAGSVTFSNLAHNVNRPSPVFGTTNKLTVSAWVNATATGNSAFLVANCPSAADKGWILYLHSTTGLPALSLNVTGPVNNYATSSGPSIVNAGWKHVTAVYDGVDIRIYVDGVLSSVPVAQTGNLDFGAATLALRLGNAPASTAYPFTGSIDEVRVYNRALSAADVANLYAFAASTFVVNDITAGTIYQRAKGTTSKTITLSGTYSSLPTTIEAQLYLEDTSTVAQAWTALTGTTIGGGNWSGSLSVPQGGMYNLQVRGKDAGGTVLETSIRYGHPFGVGILVAVLGQSNWANMFVNSTGTLTPHTATRKHASGAWATNTGDGAINLANKLQAGTSLPVGLLAYAVGGTTIANWTDTSGGSVWSTFLTNLALAGGDCEVVSFQQGEQDAVGLTPKATYKAGLDTLYANLQAATGRTAAELPFACVLLGNIDHVLSTDASTQEIRQGQQEWIRETSGAVYGGSAVDMVQTDGFHWSVAYNARMGLRNAQAILGKLGAAAYGASGPRIYYAQLSGSQITVYIAHESGGTSLKELDGSTDGGSLTGFALTDGSGSLAISSTAFSGNTILLNLGRAVVGGVTLTYQYGEKPDITNPVFDNTSPQGDTVGLPLQPMPALSVSAGIANCLPRIGVGI